MVNTKKKKIEEEEMCCLDWKDFKQNVCTTKLLFFKTIYQYIYFLSGEANLSIVSYNE